MSHKKDDLNSQAIILKPYIREENVGICRKVSQRRKRMLAMITIWTIIIAVIIAISSNGNYWFLAAVAIFWIISYFIIKNKKILPTKQFVLTPKYIQRKNGIRSKKIAIDQVQEVVHQGNQMFVINQNGKKVMTIPLENNDSTAMIEYFAKYHLIDSSDQILKNKNINYIQDPFAIREINKEFHKAAKSEKEKREEKMIYKIATYIVLGFGSIIAGYGIWATISCMINHKVFIGDLVFVIFGMAIVYKGLTIPKVYAEKETYYLMKNGMLQRIENEAVISLIDLQKVSCVEIVPDVVNYDCPHEIHYCCGHGSFCLGSSDVFIFKDRLKNELMMMPVLFDYWHDMPEILSRMGIPCYKDGTIINNINIPEEATS